MLKHKVGDIVTLNDKVDVDQAMRFRPGVNVLISQICSEGDPENEHYTVHLAGGSTRNCWWIKDYEIEEKGQIFNIKTDPWFIRVNSEQEFDVIQDWLEENYGTCLMVEYGSWMEYLTNTDSGGTVARDRVMQGNGDPISTTPRKEIKLTFKTTVDSVQYPIVETEQQIKMKQLQQTIDKAARELKELREMRE